MGAVRKGLMVMSWGVMAVIVGMTGLVLLFVASLVASAIAWREVNLVTGFYFNVVPFIVLAASALIFIGKLLCLKAPIEAGYSALVGSVLCSVVRVVLMLLGRNIMADVADLAGMVLLVIFVRGLATHLGRTDLAERATFAMWVLVWTIVGLPILIIMIFLLWPTIAWSFALLWSTLRGLDGALAEVTWSSASGTPAAEAEDIRTTRTLS